MKKSKKLLNTVLTVLQTDQRVIRNVSDIAVRVDMRKDLQSYLQELNAMEFQAYSIAAARGWELQETAPGICFLSAVISRIRLVFGKQDSKIAEMLIHSCTCGMISLLRMRRICACTDGDVRSLCQKMLDCQQSKIREMKQYL